MEKVKQKNGFASGLGFILASAGSAVGLGNLWGFPYKTSANGGAAFVIVYILSVILMGSIVMIAEIHLGRRAQANPVSAYKKVNKGFGWLGLFAVVIPIFITFYYVVIGGFTVRYTVNSIFPTENVLQTFSGNTLEMVIYTAIFLLIAVVIVMFGIKQGVEKASKILMPTLFIILIAVVIYCLCLGEGVSEGLNYYLNPNFAELGFDGVLAAMSQAFFSLSLGMGIMVSYGSYTDKNINIGKSIIAIGIFDTVFALLAGLAIFPAIYHYQAVNPGTELVSGGMFLLFESLPLIFADLGVLGQIISFFFFGMVIIAAVTSVISLLEVATQFVIQRFKLKRKIAILIVALLCFAVSIPIGMSLGYNLNGISEMTLFGKNLLDVFDLIANTVLMPVCAIGVCIAVAWFIEKRAKASTMLGLNNLSAKLNEEGLNLGKFSKIFVFMIKYVTPLFIAVIEVFGIMDIIWPTVAGGRVFDMNGLGIVLTALAILVVIIIVYLIFFKNKETGCNADELEINAKFAKASTRAEGAKASAEIYTEVNEEQSSITDTEAEYIYTEQTDSTKKE